MRPMLMLYRLAMTAGAAVLPAPTVGEGPMVRKPNRTLIADVNQAGEKIDLSGLSNVRSFADPGSNVGSTSRILVGNDGTVVEWNGKSRRWWDGESLSSKPGCCADGEWRAAA